MADETTVITEILKSTGVYDWAVSKVKSEAEIIRNKWKGPSGCGAWKGHEVKQ